MEQIINRPSQLFLGQDELRDIGSPLLEKIYNYLRLLLRSIDANKKSIKRYFTSREIKTMVDNLYQCDPRFGEYVAISKRVSSVEFDDFRNTPDPYYEQSSWNRMTHSIQKMVSDVSTAELEALKIILIDYANEILSLSYADLTRLGITEHPPIGYLKRPKSEQMQILKSKFCRIGERLDEGRLAIARQLEENPPISYNTKSLPQGSIESFLKGGRKKKRTRRKRRTAKKSRKYVRH